MVHCEMMEYDILVADVASGYDLHMRNNNDFLTQHTDSSVQTNIKLLHAMICPSQFYGLHIFWQFHRSIRWNLQSKILTDSPGHSDGSIQSDYNIESMESGREREREST